MTSTPDAPEHDGSDLQDLRAEIDELKDATGAGGAPAPGAELAENEPEPEPTDAIGSEKWDEPASEEKLDL